MSKEFGELSEINVESHSDGFRLIGIDLRGAKISRYISQEEDMGLQVYEFLQDIQICGTHEEAY